MLRVLTAILLVLSVPTLPALAKGKGNGGGDRDEWRDDHHERDHHEDDRDEWQRDHRGDWHRFSDRERSWWRDYWRDQYAHGHCPPGLAKKHNGCLPPGHARRYVIGRPLPPGVVLVAVPASVLGYLPRPEPGYRYGMVDGDLVKLAVGTSLVVDAMSGLFD